MFIELPQPLVSSADHVLDLGEEFDDPQTVTATPGGGRGARWASRIRVVAGRAGRDDLRAHLRTHAGVDPADASELTFTQG